MVQAAVFLSAHDDAVVWREVMAWISPRRRLADPGLTYGLSRSSTRAWFPCVPCRANSKKNALSRGNPGPVALRAVPLHLASSRGGDGRVRPERGSPANASLLLELLAWSCVDVNNGMAGCRDGEGGWRDCRKAGVGIRARGRARAGAKGQRPMPACQHPGPWRLLRPL